MTNTVINIQGLSSYKACKRISDFCIKNDSYHYGYIYVIYCIAPECYKLKMVAKIGYSNSIMSRMSALIYGLIKAQFKPISVFLWRTDSPIYLEYLIHRELANYYVRVTPPKKNQFHGYTELFYADHELVSSVLINLGEIDKNARPVHCTKEV